MDKEIKITLITSFFAFLTLLFKMFEKEIKKALRQRYERKEDKRLRSTATSSIQHEETIEDIMVKNLLQHYNMSYVHLIKWHNGGKEVHELSIKRITIIKEFTADSHVKHVKHLWQAKEVDKQFNRMIQELFIDRVKQIEDIELLEDKKGIRKIYNRLNGKELILVDLGWIDYEFYFMVFQHDLRSSKYDLEPKLFDDEQKGNIKYWSEKIWELCTNARKS